LGLGIHSNLGISFNWGFQRIVHSLPSKIALLRERLLRSVNIFSQRVCIFIAKVRFCGLGFVNNFSDYYVWLVLMTRIFCRFWLFIRWIIWICSCRYRWCIIWWISWSTILNCLCCRFIWRVSLLFVGLSILDWVFVPHL